MLAKAEDVQIDFQRMLELRDRLGTGGAVDLVCMAIEDLAVLLAGLQFAMGQGHMNAVRNFAGKICTKAGHIGLKSLANVAGDVYETAARDDATALLATAARLSRVGEQSLLTFWDADNLSN